MANKLAPLRFIYVTRVLRIPHQSIYISFLSCFSHSPHCLFQTIPLFSRDPFVGPTPQTISPLPTSSRKMSASLDNLSQLSTLNLHIYLHLRTLSSLFQYPSSCARQTLGLCPWGHVLCSLLRGSVCWNLWLDSAPPQLLPIFLSSPYRTPTLNFFSHSFPFIPLQPGFCLSNCWISSH